MIFSAILFTWILLTPIFFDFYWNALLRAIFPHAELFFRYITELGGTLLYLGIIFSIYWGIDKKFGKTLFVIYSISSIVNYYAKALIGNERPPQEQWILIGVGHLATPSGHTMSSMVFWGYTAMKIKRTSMWILSVIIIFLVGLSRIYLGLHWLGDILTGWAVGIIILSLASIAEPTFERLVSRHRITFICGALAAIGVFLITITDFLYPLSYLYNFGGNGGKLIGFSIGIILEEELVKFRVHEEHSSTGKIIMRVLVGLISFSVLYIGLYFTLDTSNTWLNALVYIISLPFGFFIWPLIFKKIKL
ncbi:MAG: phosphatase PAP2 family protein [Promethearchaeota archaeon]